MDEGPGDHDAHLMDDDPSETVACAKCGKQIWAYAQRCHHCGVHFSGEAWQFDRQTGAGDGSSGWWPWVVAALILALLGWLLPRIGTGTVSAF
ncbi:MAG TPA: hypothetical protein VGA66_04160 [Mycobacterium sp.]